MSASDDEVAAALLALLAVTRTQPEATRQPPSNWNSKHRNLRVPLPRGSAAWRDSLRKP